MSSKHAPSSRWVHLASGSLATLFFCAVVWACASEVDPGGTYDPNAEGGPGTKTDARPNNSGDDAATPDGSTQGTDATDPNLKVAFIGDTGVTGDFKKVLELIVREKADLVMIQGDLTYGIPFFQTTPAAWFKFIDNEINKAQSGSTAAVTIPFFVAKGNHDNAWDKADGLGPGLKARMTMWGTPSENGDPTTKNYSVVHRGLKMVMVDSDETVPTRADFVNDRLKDDAHIWKICSWHRNQRASNVGGKSDEMGWAAYENCRTHGAIVAQAHSHTYSRSKTLTNDTAQTVDVACSDPNAVCVGPGKHFFFDSSMGGEDIRPLDNAGGPYWATTYSGSFGALFITFNVDGDPKKAAGYFKTVDNVVTDPPAASGKTVFTITKSP